LAIFFAMPTSAVPSDVVGDQEFARAPTRWRRRGMETGSPTSGWRSGTVPISWSSASNGPRVCFSRFTRSGVWQPLVEVDGNLQLVPGSRCQRARQLDAILQRHTLDGDKRHHAAAPMPRVRPGAGQVDERRAFSTARERRLGTAAGARRRSEPSGYGRRPIRDSAGPLPGPETWL